MHVHVRCVMPDIVICALKHCGFRDASLYFSVEYVPQWCSTANFTEESLKKLPAAEQTAAREVAEVLAKNGVTLLATMHEALHKMLASRGASSSSSLLLSSSSSSSSLVSRRHYCFRRHHYYFVFVIAP